MHIDPFLRPALQTRYAIANIIVTPDLAQIKITDFGIASLLSRENPTVSSANRLEGTLCYLSPEQTGTWHQLGFILVRQGDGLAVYEAARP